MSAVAKPLSSVVPTINIVSRNLFGLYEPEVEPSYVTSKYKKKTPDPKNPTMKPVPIRSIVLTP